MDQNPLEEFYDPAPNSLRADPTSRAHELTPPPSLSSPIPTPQIAALQLVSRGLISLSTPIGQYLPGLANPLILRGFDSKTDEPILEPIKTPITLTHLLDHTTGLSGIGDWEDFRKYREMKGMGEGLDEEDEKVSLSDAHSSPLRLDRTSEHWDRFLAIAFYRPGLLRRHPDSPIRARIAILLLVLHGLCRSAHLRPYRVRHTRRLPVRRPPSPFQSCLYHVLLL